MPCPRFQFTLRDLLGATFWMAVSLAGWVATFRSHSAGPLMLLAALVGFLTPLMAVATLLRRKSDGLLIVLAVIGASYMLLAIMLGTGLMK